MPNKDNENFSIDQFMTPREFIDLIADVKRVVRFIDQIEITDIRGMGKLVESHEKAIQGGDKPGLLTRIDRVERIISVVVWVITLIASALIIGGISFIGFLLTHGGAVFTFPGGNP